MTPLLHRVFWQSLLGGGKNEWQMCWWCLCLPYMSPIAWLQQKLTLPWQIPSMTKCRSRSGWKRTMLQILLYSNSKRSCLRLRMVGSTRIMHCGCAPLLPPRRRKNMRPTWPGADKSTAYRSSVHKTKQERKILTNRVSWLVKQSKTHTMKVKNLTKDERLLKRWWLIEPVQITSALWVEVAQRSTSCLLNQRSEYYIEEDVWRYYEKCGRDVSSFIGL